MDDLSSISTSPSFVTGPHSANSLEFSNDYSLPTTTISESHRKNVAAFGSFMETVSTTDRSALAPETRLVLSEEKDGVVVQKPTSFWGRTARFGRSMMGLDDKGLNQNYETLYCFRTATEAVYGSEVFQFAFPEHQNLAIQRKDLTVAEVKKVFSKIEIFENLFEEDATATPIKRALTTQHQELFAENAMKRAIKDSELAKTDATRAEQEQAHILQKLDDAIDAFVEQKLKDKVLKTEEEASSTKASLRELTRKELQAGTTNPILEKMRADIAKLTGEQRSRVIKPPNSVSIKSAPRTWHGYFLQFISADSSIEEKAQNRDITSFLYNTLQTEYGEIASFAFPPTELRYRHTYGSQLSADNIQHILNKADLMKDFLANEKSLIKSFLNSNAKTEEKKTMAFKSKAIADDCTGNFKAAREEAEKAFKEANAVAMKQLAPQDSKLQSLLQQKGDQFENALQKKEHGQRTWDDWWQASLTLDINNRLEFLQKLWFQKAQEKFLIISSEADQITYPIHGGKPLSFSVAPISTHDRALRIPMTLPTASAPPYEGAFDIKNDFASV